MERAMISPFIPLSATIVEIRHLTDREKLFVLRLDTPVHFPVRPCQFVMVSLYGIGEAPISISSISFKDVPYIELCIRAIGNLTRAIHTLRPGQKVGIRGPYGNGFPIERVINKDIIIVAGGLGLAPLRSLIHYLLDNREGVGRIILLIGAKRPRDLLFQEEIHQWLQSPTLETLITVDAAEPSWKGHVGVITNLFRYISVDPKRTIASVVGPPIMYKFVIKELLGKGLYEGNIYVDLERRMRCGIGKCGHCQINGIYLCKQGPVLSYLEARKLPEAL